MSHCTIDIHRDGFTPDQNLIISAHPHCGGLYIATGGSLHSWKFLPIIGSYVVKMLDDELAPEFVKRWGWNREMGEGTHNKLMSDRDLNDMPGYAETS